MSRTYFSRGEWNAICDRCGFLFKSSQLRRTWDGLMVCPEDWEARHPQDFVRGVPEGPPPPWTRPEPEPIFRQFCTPDGQTAVPGKATPGCVQPSFISPYTT